MTRNPQAERIAVMAASEPPNHAIFAEIDLVSAESSLLNIFFCNGYHSNFLAFEVFILHVAIADNPI